MQGAFGPPHEVIGQGLHGVVGAKAAGGIEHRRPLARRGGVEHADRPPTRRPAGELSSAEDGGVVWKVHKLPRRERRSQRPVPDAARVEELRRVAELDEASRPASEPEDVRPLDEEGPVLGQELLERRQVHERGVDLDLAEVGVHRRVQGEVGGHAVLEVQPRAPEIVARFVEGIRGVTGLPEGAAPHAVGEELEPLRRRDVAQPGQVSEARHEPAFRLPDERPHGEFVLAQNGPHEADAPDLVRGAREAQLRERDTVLGRPAERVHAGGDLPHGIPRVVGEVAVVAELEIVLHPQRIDVEPEGGAMVVVGVDEDAEVVALGEGIAAAQVVGDLAGLAVEQPHADVQRLVVVEHAHGGGLGDEVPFLRVALAQVGDGRGEHPHGVVQPAVDHRGSADAHRGDRGGNEPVGMTQLCGVGTLQGEKREGGQQHARGPRAQGTTARRDGAGATSGSAHMMSREAPLSQAGQRVRAW